MGANIQLLIAQIKYKKSKKIETIGNSGGKIYKMIQSETGLLFQKCIYGNEKKARLPTC